jgi:thiol-disulfide isomerase/thioredoxin
MNLRRTVSPFLFALLATSLAFAQSPTPPSPAAAPATTPAPASPVSGIRNKISAGDLLSAESILEVHKEKFGEDGPYVNGLAWLARGALLMNERAKAAAYAADVRRLVDAKLAKGDSLEKNHDLEIALGGAIEVEAQLIQRDRGSRAATDFLVRELTRISGPVALRSRLHKRMSMIALPGQPAAELQVDDFLGQTTSLTALRGKPVVLFLWANWCGDCRAQAAALTRAQQRHASKGLQVIALTRYYDEPADRLKEKARVDSVWKADYAGLAAVPVLFSTASMEHYGGSSTPTFVFVDRQGVVRGYTPTRLTDAELDRHLAPILR